MIKSWILFLVSCLLATQVALASQKPRVAVVDVQNSTGILLRASGAKMAEWMTDELKKTKQFELVDPKKIQPIIQNATWYRTRFDKNVEAQLKNLPADYVLYCIVSKYKLEPFTFNDPLHMGEPVVPDVILEFSIRLLDLNEKQPDQRVVVSGDSLGSRRDVFMGPPYDPKDPSLDVPFYRASHKAMKDAAKQLSQ